jgi:class 3 adenylate cyclase
MPGRWLHDSAIPAQQADGRGRKREPSAGERKLITVLFADVAGFTSISERLDPEDARAMMRRGFAVMLEEAHRYEGTISQPLGDGLLALFGAPMHTKTTRVARSSLARHRRRARGLPGGASLLRARVITRRAQALRTPLSSRSWHTTRTSRIAYETLSLAKPE